jgi:4-diphosphocytidyl-2-C-methyl-D-erythritol kinase
VHSSVSLPNFFPRISKEKGYSFKLEDLSHVVTPCRIVQLRQVPPDNRSSSLNFFASSARQLINWSGELGSDITFFLSRGTAYCTGRGEVMTPVDFDPPLPPGMKLSIVKPDLGLSTPTVFKALDYDQLSAEDPEELRDTFLREGVVSIDDRYYVNDLEQPAFDCLPELKALKDELLGVDGFDHVMMSGSGTSVYCIGEPTDMDSFMSEFDGREGVSVFNTEFINRGEGWWFENPDD